MSTKSFQSCGTSDGEHTDIQMFENAEFGSLTIVDEGDRVLFAAVECAERLGYSRPHDAISRHCHDSVKRGVIDSLGREQQKIFIPEGDLYRLIARSHLPGAARFERWVFDEVLPSIRKHGAYVAPEKLEAWLSDPRHMIEALTELQAEREARVVAEGQVLELRPQAESWRSMVDGAGDYSVGDAAKILSRDPDIQIGQNTLFRWMDRRGWTYVREGIRHAYQERINQGLLVQKLYPPFWSDSAGELVTRPPQVRVTMKGLDRLRSALTEDRVLVGVAA